METKERMIKRIRNGEDITVRELFPFGVDLSGEILKNGSPLTNCAMISVFGSEINDLYIRKVYETQHYQKILASKDKKANYECYKISRLAFEKCLEVLNDKQDAEYYSIYLNEKIKTLSYGKNSIEELYALNKNIIEFNNVDISRFFLSKLGKINCDENVLQNIWFENMSVFLDSYKDESKRKDANDAIWFLVNKPENLEIPAAAFDTLEQIVLDSKDGSYNYFFMLHYPNTNFRAHERALLDSKCGITISQYANKFSAPKTNGQNKRGENQEFADLNACAEALIKSGNETAMYVFASSFGTSCNMEAMYKIYNNLSESKSQLYSGFGKTMKNEITPEYEIFVTKQA